MAESKKYNYVYMACLALLTAVMSIWELPIPPGPRQAELLYKAWAILQGQVPYRDFWENGSPGVLYIYALALKVFGHCYISINIIDLIWRCGTSVVLYMLASRLYGKREGVIAGLLYISALSLNGASWQWNSLPESYMILPMALGLYYFLDETITSSALSGLCIGVAGLIKLPALLMAPALIAIVLIRPRITWEPRPKRAKILSFLFGIMLLLTMLIFCLLLSWSIVYFVNQVFVFNIYYNEKLNFFTTFVENYYFFIPLWCVVWIAARKVEEREKRIDIVTAWLLVSFCIMAMLSFIHVHTYWAAIFYIPLGPAVILGSRGLGRIHDYIRDRDYSLANRIIVAIAVVFWLIVPVLIDPVFHSHNTNQFKLSYEYLTGHIDRDDYMSRFVGNTFIDYNIKLNFDMADYLAKSTNSEDTVLGSPFINFLAKRKMPTRYITFFPYAFKIQNRKSEILRQSNEALYYKDLESNMPKCVAIFMPPQYNAINYDEKIIDKSMSWLGNQFPADPDYKFDNYAEIYCRK